MKKTIQILSTILTALVSTNSCGFSSKQSSQAEEMAMKAYIKSIDSTTVAIKNAQSSEDLQKITSTFAVKAKAFATAHEKDKVSKDVLDQITKSITCYQQATEQKAKEIVKKELE